MLSIKNLHATLEDNTPILNGVNLEIKSGEVHAIMGPNGAGKSTLSKVISGHPSYQITQGEILLQGKNIAELDIAARANAGIFISMQYPIEIPGVNNIEFLRMALDSKRASQGLEKISDSDFNSLIEKSMELLEMDNRYTERGVNEGFSGGEKKRNEILQMAVLQPKIAFLDETDSGLDIDALRIVSKGINALRNQERGIILVTHYKRLLDYVKPDYIHVLRRGKIVLSGGAELADELEAKGYDWIPGDEE
ncbi:MAG: Fe-S cluster assembly ATPase SufC [Fibrobacteraceae bacterium]|jgi:Fe-S cluster assembly ATP-binding protein|nr:Fe-S cluster assembly ATPase SufC [Fibrobacteraceae bacterium]MEE1067431.1 Fe-S cluster assembly ATPase SufC [Fibrobacteraceae bacterium]